MTEQELNIYLKKTETIIGEKWLDNAISGRKEIASYYTKLRSFYKNLHSKEGAMHFPIKTETVRSHADGLMYQVMDLDNLIKKNNYKKVVEFGSGAGFNIINLAKRYPDVGFVGYDLTPKNINETNKKIKAEGLKNIEIRLNDFEKIDFNNFEKTDLIYSIDAMCYAEDLNKIIKNIFNVLNKNGRLVLYDGYGTEKLRSANESIVKAADYLAKGYILPNPQFLNDAVKSGKDANFKNVNVVDYTENIFGNLKKFEDGVKLVFKWPLWTKFLLKLKLFPMELFRHSLAGLYGPYLLRNRYTGYFRVDYEK